MGQCGPHSSRRPHRGGGNRGPHAGTPSCYPDKRGSPSIFPQPVRLLFLGFGLVRVGVSFCVLFPQPIDDEQRANDEKDQFGQ